MKKINFNQPRAILLVEIERYCCNASCLRLNRIGLTRSEIPGYKGFNCERCEMWNDDEVKQRDVPAEWQPLLPNKV
ncbi:MAG: hypothetical protein M3209_06815 [Acidobacteriota bacterium]|nr:hypothetical protein [Acidobacteriota bacterium]